MVKQVMMFCGLIDRVTIDDAGKRYRWIFPHSEEIFGSEEIKDESMLPQLSFKEVEYFEV